MNYSIITEPEFLREVKRLSKNYNSFKHDLERLQEELLSNPAAGTDLGGGVHKVRMAIAGKNRGKSHGARVITYVYEVDEERGVITLLAIYDKAERESLPAARIAELLALAKERAGVADE